MHHRRLRSGILAGVIGLSLVVGACGGPADGGGGGGGGGGAQTPAPPADKVVLTPADNVPFALRKGTYRLAWKTTDCSSLSVEIRGDTGYSREKTSTLPAFNMILTSVLEGTYILTQTDPACADWQITIEKIC
jgi:hypothetical protein